MANKNIKKIQRMLKGEFIDSSQVGYTPTKIERKVGEKWFDSEGYEWEQKQGYRSKLSRTPDVGMFSKQCKDCKKNCSPKTAKPWDRDCWKADGRCYHCQMNYELDLQFDKPIRWFAYRRLKDFKNMKSIEKDMEQWVDEMEKQRQENPFDETVANAMANGEVEMSIKKNT